MTGGFSSASGILRAFSGDPKFRTISNVLWGPLQREINAGLADYGDIKAKGNKAFDAWLAKYLADTTNAEKRSGQEIASIDRYYDGTMDNLLRDMRQRRKVATHKAAELAGKKATRSLNLSRVGSDGGASSYDSRSLMRMLGDIDTAAALDDLTQERADLGFLEGNKIALGSRRQAIADELIRRELVPEDVRRGLFDQNLGFLAKLGQLDRNNKIYGVQKKTTGLERWANAIDAFSGGLNQDFSTAAALSGSL